MRAAWLVGLVVVALLLGACGEGSSIATAAPSMRLPATRSPLETGAATPGATAPASPAESSLAPSPGGLLAYDATDADVVAGTYAARAFRVPFTAEINTDLKVRDADDLEPFVYIGQDTNAPENGDEEFDAMLLEQVLDPANQRALAPLTGDVFEWFRRHTRLEPVPGTEQTYEVDGHPARQLDLLPSDPVSCGSDHPNLECVLIGYGPTGPEPFVLFAGSKLRIVVVDHDGTPILFAYQATNDERFADRSAVFDHWVRTVDFQK